MRDYLNKQGIAKLKQGLINFISDNYRSILIDILLTAACIAATLAVIFLVGNVGGELEFHKTAAVILLIFVFSRHLYKNETYWLITNAFIILIANATVAMQINTGLNAEVNDVINTEAFIIAVSNVILSISNSFCNAIRYPLSVILITGFSLFMLLFWGYYFAEHVWLAPDTLLAIMQTDQSEALSYVTNHYSINIVFCVLTAILFIFTFTICTAKYGGMKKSSKVAGVLCVLFILTNIYMGLRMVETAYLASPFYAAKKGLDAYDNFAKLRDVHNASISVNAQRQEDYSGVYVLVIGESQTKEHMQAYGYSRDNTPWLTREVENGNAILFQKAFSCHTHTVPVLSYALTEKNQYNQKKLEECSSLIDNLNSAGYKTIWLSNQVQYGAWDTPIRVIADSAEEKIFINHNLGETTDTDFYDDKLIEYLDKIEINTNTFIVIHLMGCHGSYRDRYPDSYNIYGEKEEVDAYDNSVRYNDYVIEGIFNKVSKIPNFKGMVYFSDHGDDPDNKLGHNADKFTPIMAKIPFYMIFSDDYKAKHPDRYQTIKNAANNMFTNDMIFNTVLAVMGIKNEDIYEPENDITSPNYNLDSTRFKTLHGKKNVADI